MSKISSQIEQLSIDRNNDGTKSAKIQYVSGFFVLFAVISTLIAVNNQTDASIEKSIHAEKNPEQELQTVKLNQSFQVKAQSAEDNTKKIILDASGHIVARRITTVSSRITGKIERLNIEEGQTVKRNDILAELDDRQARITYQLAIAELAAIKAVNEELEILYQHEKQLFKRRQKLAANHLISDEIAESSEMKTRQIASQLKNKSALMEQSRQRLELAQYQLDQHKIRAPFDAVVISKNAQVGELISAGSAGGGFIRTGVGTIVDMSSLEIEVEVGESYINRVHPGQKVESRLDAYPKWIINSEVVAIIPTADRQKATIKVRIKLLETDLRILPDMSIKVSFLSSNHSSTNVVSN
ncbi:MAG: efflux RND transporter periplasmic adaptor subunit [Gammaproteobacteria bacterium]|nr:efflux RND transporter periplasmic adaptor subunit [Gammaproteobacteria bacterium]